MRMDINKPFSDFARFIAHLTGQPFFFILAFSIVVLWLLSGFYFDFSQTWQLFINSFTTIATFLMVFLIQSTQNRDGEAIQIKLDELIRSHVEAHNSLLDLEELTEEQLNVIKEKYEKLARIARADLEKGKPDTTLSEV